MITEIRKEGFKTCIKIITVNKEWRALRKGLPSVHIELVDGVQYEIMLCLKK